MPKSRGRKRKANRNAPRRGHPESVSAMKARAVADLPVLRATDRAEARGDAVATLELIEQDLADREDEYFWRPDRLRRLWQLAFFGRLLPRWATSRWILGQAAQSLDSRSRQRVRKAIEIALAMRGGEALAESASIDVRTRVIDHDWVFRQLLLYEYGGLQDFVARFASAKLLSGADLIHEWARAPMGGFRFVRECRRTLVWEDLSTNAELESLNLGAASLLDQGECALGRLVPIEGGAMFETGPLRVPESLARCVALDPTGWVAALSAECQRQHGEAPWIVTEVDRFDLLTDVPPGAQQMVARAVAGRTEEQVTHAIDPDPGTELTALVRAALSDQVNERDPGVSPWPAAAAALLDPGVFIAIAETVVPTDQASFERLSRLLPAPADALCRQIAHDLERAA